MKQQKQILEFKNLFSYGIYLNLLVFSTRGLDSRLITKKVIGQERELAYL
jgi:hypothetical protein